VQKDDLFLNPAVDNLDIKIIDLLIHGKNNKKIASTMKIPLSTIQRRTRQLISKQLVIAKNELNFEKFGFKRVLLHIYLSNRYSTNSKESSKSKKNIIYRDTYRKFRYSRICNL
jgi:predicted transcriptional regulator